MRGWSWVRSRLSRGTQATLERLRGKAGAPRGLTEANVLAISDLHLGHDLKRGVDVAQLKPSSLERHLVTLLDHHRVQREGGLPWRLVIAGDAVDFIGISLVPGPEDAVAFPVSANERLYGLASDPVKAVWKLEQVLIRHAPLVRSLAAFAAAGHEIVVVCGNHDMEWGWTEVQDTLREALAYAAYPSPVAARVSEHARLEARRETVRRRLSFREWFYLEPGRLYVEHGHLHDEYAVSENMLSPSTRGSPRPIREPVSTLALRYFGNKHTTLDMNEVERWSVLDFIRWGRRGGRLWRTFGDYLVMCLRVLAFSVKASAKTLWGSVIALLRLGRGIATEDEKLGQIREMLRTVRAGNEELAKELRALMRPPAERSVLATARMLYFDRLALVAGVLVSALVCGLSSGPGEIRLGIFAGIALVGAFTNAWLGRARLVDSHPKLIAAAHRMSVLFRVPIVVMGHSHRSVSQEVGLRARYFNLGTWLAPSREESGPAGFPHLVIRGHHAELRRWRLDRTAHTGVA